MHGWIVQHHPTSGWAAFFYCRSGAVYSVLPTSVNRFFFPGGIIRINISSMRPPAKRRRLSAPLPYVPYEIVHEIAAYLLPEERLPLRLVSHKWKYAVDVNDELPLCSVVTPLVFWCQRGGLEEAKFVARKTDDSQVAKSQALHWACQNGHLPVAKWIYYNIDGANVHFVKDIAFRAACYCGKLPVAKWIYYDIGGVVFHDWGDWVFGPYNGRVQKWLRKIYTDL